MSSEANKFKFVSPGIFLNEIDQSHIPAFPEGVGPVVIGRARKGPGMVPTKVDSFSEFVETFGNPISGKGGSADVWRDGNYSSPTYAAYAAQAFLSHGTAPLTFVRLMGTQHPDVTDTTRGAGAAGWTTTDVSPDGTLADNGGPFGLFVFNSSSATAATDINPGSLAAVWYCDEGVVPVLSGAAVHSEDVAIEGAAAIVRSDSSGNFKVRILRGTALAEDENVTFTMSEGSDNFIRKVFNTNPQLVNSTIESSNNRKYYWLGETYERYLNDNGLIPGSTQYGVILALVSGSNFYGSHQKAMAYRDAHSGWFFSQNLSATSTYEYDNMTKLFKFVGIDGHGEWLQNNVKASISNIRAPANEHVKYGTFDVTLRKASDSDLAPVVLERYSDCNLDPGSFNYIARKIGDTYNIYDDAEDRYREYGNYPNKSRYLRVVMGEEIDNGGSDPVLLPFGVYGPPRYPGFELSMSGCYDELATGVGLLGPTDRTSPDGTAYALGSSSVPDVNSLFAGKNQYGVVFTSPGRYSSAHSVGTEARIGFGTASISYPSALTRSTATSDGAHPTKNAYFGLHTGRSTTNANFDPGYADYLRAFSNNIISNSGWSDDFGLSALPGNLVYSWKFSLDEIVLTTGSTFNSSRPATGISEATWTSGSHKAGSSWCASNSLGDNPSGSKYQNLLDSGVNRFTSPLYGAFDGLDITERDPFRNTRIDDSESETGNYTYYTIKRALNTAADPEELSCNAITVPGLTNESLTKYVIDICEERADAIAIVDLKGGFQPRHESSNSISDRKGNLDSVLSNMKDRNLNSSYGCCYYPWITIRDNIGSSVLKAPPSIAALGVFGNTEKVNDVWFAPAGYARGNLSLNAAGIPVVGIETKLTKENRDDLYDLNINPIASFATEGIVVFGQKTLQATPSALDRINVRRLLIYLKKGISRISSTTLFQPNVQATWNGFKANAENFLSDVKIRFGLDDFRVVLDETTTTSDLIDRNIMYAKIFIKPTRAIEYIAIDFIITRSGASFED